MKFLLFLTALIVISSPIAGCSSRSKNTTEDHQPTEKDLEAVRVFFIQEWNARFIECNDWSYSRSEGPSPIILGMKLSPARFIYEWQPLSESDRLRGIKMRNIVFIATEQSTVHAEGSWFSPFKRGSGYLVAMDLYIGYPGADSREDRNAFLESRCVQFKECVGLNINVFADGKMEVVDDGAYWDHLTTPENCGVIPD